MDARRGGDEWLLVVVAFDLPADTDALAAGALEALGLRGGAEFGPAAPQAALLNAMLGGAMRLVVPWVAR